MKYTNNKKSKKMVSKELTKKIEEAINSGYFVFYNSTGNTNAFRLMVRHISFAKNLGCALKLYNNEVVIKKECFLVDFEKEEVLKLNINDKITIIDLEFMENED